MKHTHFLTLCNRWKFLESGIDFYECVFLARSGENSPPENYKTLKAAKAISCHLGIDFCYPVSSQEGQNLSKFIIF